MQDEISGWNEWTAAFGQIEELSSASELHGIVVGLSCVSHAPTQNEWQQILQTLDIKPLDDAALQLLTEESEDIAAAIHEDDLDYGVMLPDDTHPLAERVHALADWCSGVVLGFALAAGHVRKDEQEWIEHLQDVAAVMFSEEDDNEEGEEGYNELYEFVRLIPISLATGRKKVQVSDTTLLKRQINHADTVEVYTPHRH